MTSLRRLQSTWNRLGRENPMWAVLTSEEDWDEESFFQSGRDEIDELMRYADGLGVEFAHGSAIDFGCGVGRLSRALASHFGSVTGVDIAPSMVAEARRLNADVANVRFVLNDAPDLSQFEAASCDLAYSNITLQHMDPALARGYIAELVRVLARPGILIFQLPSEPAPRPGVLRRSLNGLRGRMEMYSMPRDEVTRLLEDAGATVKDVRPDESGGEGWSGYRYAAVKL